MFMFIFKFIYLNYSCYTQPADDWNFLSPGTSSKRHVKLFIRWTKEYLFNTNRCSDLFICGSDQIISRYTWHCEKYEIFSPECCLANMIKYAENCRSEFLSTIRIIINNFSVTNSEIFCFLSTEAKFLLWVFSWTEVVLKTQEQISAFFLSLWSK